MALFNYASREITAKIVYYGPALGGKTTSLQVIHQRIAPNQRGKLLSLATETDRTIFFDLLPLKLGEINGFRLKFQLYTVPGQVKYDNTRKIVLQGADAIVFVADSQKSRRQANIESFKNLQENLLAQGKLLEEMPLVFEYNKRDVNSILSVEELNQDLNPRDLPYFETVASQGRGVMETLELISKLTLEYLEKQLWDQKPKASSTVIPKSSKEKETEQPEEPQPVVPSDSQEILDLTLVSPFEESTSSFSDQDLAGLQLESDLLDSSDQSRSPAPEMAAEEDLLVASKPIGYGNNIQVEEVEFADLQLEEEDLAMQSQFFDLKEVEAQAFRDLENFLGPLKDPQEEEDSFDTQKVFEEAAASLSIEEGILEFTLQPEYEEPVGAVSEPALLEIGEDSSNLNLEEKVASDDLFNFTPDEGGKTTYDGEEKTSEALSPDLSTAESDDPLGFTFDEAEKTSEAFSSDLSATRPEDLLGFTLDEEEEKPFETFLLDQPTEEEFLARETSSLIESAKELDFDQQTFDESLIPPEPETVEQVVETSSKKSPEDTQVSRVLDLEEHPQGVLEEFNPVTSAGDPSLRLMGFSKYLYQKGEECLTKGTELDLSLSVLLYYLAVETGLKAVALKFETCNPEIAAMPLVLDSIEEETDRPLGGRKVLEEQVIKTKNDVQLRLLFPDAETCQRVARTAERFLETLAQDFLNIEFSRLPVISIRSL